MMDKDCRKCCRYFSNDSIKYLPLSVSISQPCFLLCWHYSQVTFLYVVTMRSCSWFSLIIPKGLCSISLKESFFHIKFLVTHPTCFWLAFFGGCVHLYVQIYDRDCSIGGGVTRSLMLWRRDNFPNILMLRRPEYWPIRNKTIINAILLDSLILEFAWYNWIKRISKTNFHHGWVSFTWY